jgi:hypothetical protein
MPTAEVTANKTADYSGRLKKLFVLELIDTYKYNGTDLFQAFQKRLDEQLRECGVEASHFSREPPPAGSKPMSLDDPGIVAAKAAIANVHPDAMLSIGETSYRATNGYLTEAQYLLRLKDLHNGREVWNATVTLAPHRGTLAAAGEELAGDVVNRLKQDDILRSCGTGGGIAAAPATAPTDPPAGQQTTFSYDGKPYPTAAAMMDAERRDYATKTDALPKEQNPIKGRALVVLPTDEALVQLNTAAAAFSADWASATRRRCHSSSGGAG